MSRLISSTRYIRRIYKNSKKTTMLPVLAQEKQRRAHRMSAHHVRIKKDKKGKRQKVCKDCGCVCKKCDDMVDRRRREIMKSAPAHHKYYFGYISKSPLNATESKTEVLKNGEQATEENFGLLGQLKGMLKSRDGPANVPRVYRHFDEPPEPQPYLICFDTMLDFLHREVMRSCKEALALVANVDGSSVVNIQYIPQKVFFGSPGVGDRWIIRISTKFGVKKLLESGIRIKGKEVCLRLFDDVTKEEYKQFKGLHRMVELMGRPKPIPRPETAPAL